MKNQKGFSLIELLVVVIIIAIIAAIAIPSLLASRRAANEGSAISSLRVIHSAEATWHATTGLTANYGTLTNLGDAGLIDSAIQSGQKSGYRFYVGNAAGVYCAAADPITYSGTTATGTREFGVGSANGGQIVGAVATADAAAVGTPSAGAVTCTAAGALGGGAVIGN
jgi:type IV pilus assembly protein PilA